MKSLLMASAILVLAAIAWLSPVKSFFEPLHMPTGAVQGSGGQEASAAKPSDRTEDRAAIQANIDAFVKAYNSHNAKDIATLFTADGQVVSEDNETSEGREAIERVFAEVFADTPQTKIEVSVSSLRFIGSDLAVEVGTSKATRAPGETPENGKYTVLHVKRDGKWQMALARDSEGETPSAHEHLLPLAWLVGEWMDESPDQIVFTSCRWSDDKKFLLQDIRVQMSGKQAMKVTQRIGWDPLSQRIRSWVFDSEGGFGEGTWARQGDAWIVKATGVSPDGKPGSSTNVYVHGSKDQYIWRSTDRVLGDEVMPPVEIKVVRKPPEPQGSK